MRHLQVYLADSESLPHYVIGGRDSLQDNILRLAALGSTDCTEEEIFAHFSEVTQTVEIPTTMINIAYCLAFLLGMRDGATINIDDAGRPNIAVNAEWNMVILRDEITFWR